MNIQDAIRAVRSKFKPMTDTGDTWTIITERWTGDCEDFAATVAWLACDQERGKFIWAVLKGSVVFHWAETKTGKHVVGFDPKSGGYYDNLLGGLLPRARYTASGISIRARCNRIGVLWRLKRSILAGGQP